MAADKANASRIKKIARVLATLCTVFGCSLFIYALFYIVDTVFLYGQSAAVDELLWRTFTLLGFVCELITFAVFVRFSRHVVKKRSLFDVNQVKRLVHMGCFMLVDTALDIAEVLVIHFGSVNESFLEAFGYYFDFAPLLLSLLLFALAAIFEYGRVLQEDNDSIL